MLLIDLETLESSERRWFEPGEYVHPDLRHELAAAPRNGLTAAEADLVRDDMRRQEGGGGSDGDGGGGGGGGGGDDVTDSESEVESVSDVAEVLEDESAYLILRLRGQFPVRLPRERVVRHRVCGELRPALSAPR